MAAKPCTADVVDALSYYGFTYEGVQNGHLQFSGALRHKNEVHECDIYVPKDFSSLPGVKLRKIPSLLGPVAPHLSAEGWLCYLTSSSTVVDVFDPVGQTLAFLNRAEFVLGQILDGTAVEDLAEEFFAYWGKSSFHCFLDIENYKSRRLHLLTERGDQHVHRAFLSDDPPRTAVKAAALGRKVHFSKTPVLSFCSTVRPRPSLTKWPVQNLGQFMAWQSDIDIRTALAINKKVVEAFRGGAPMVVVVIKSPGIVYSLAILFCDVGDKPKHKVSIQQLRGSAVVPYVSGRIDDNYVAERNAPAMKTLEGKKIVLIGCGTVGGYLADLLVRAGAGIQGGELVLIDNEELSTGNLGRHILGLPDVGENKARRLAYKFLRDFPGANVKSIELDVRDVNLARADLVIDATGEESLGQLLEKKYTQSQARIAIWIEGPGVAARAFLKSQEKHACSYCLATHVRAGDHRATIEQIPKLYAGQGCEQEYVPFPATVSMQAACLGIEMVLDWVASKAMPTLRTKLLASGFTAVPDSTPESIPECPACSS